MPDATFLLLNNQLGWQPAHDADGAPLLIGVAIGDSLRLAADPDGALALGAHDGSLGGLALPRGMALDDTTGTLYLLEPDGPWIRRYDAASQEFVRLPAVGGAGHAPRRFHRPAQIAIANGLLYVADRGNHRVQVFDLDHLALVAIWSSRPSDMVPPRFDRAPLRDPVDVATQSGSAYILDRQRGRVLRHTPPRDALVSVVDEPQASGRWTRVLVDRTGHIFLYDAAANRLDRFDPAGRYLGAVSEAGDVRDRFDPPPIRLDHRGRFCLPGDLARACQRGRPKQPPPPENPGALCPPFAPDGSGLLFNRDGSRATRAYAEPPGPPIYRRDGTVIIGPLDSDIYRCQWHRIVLDLTLPGGTRIELSSYAAGEQRLPSTMPDSLWDVCYIATGPMQPPPDQNTSDSPAPDNDHEFLVQSREGQYLWLRMRLHGDGHHTPAVRAVRAHYPRDSYLAYLPAVFAADDESRWFLERFLAVFQTEWDAFETRIDDIALYFDPQAVPDAFIPYLAGWLALPLEPTWSAAQNRRLLVAARRFYQRRGTPHSLRAYLRVYLHNFSGVPADAQGEYPVIVEGYREREHLTLNRDQPSSLSPLWGPGVVGRLQLGVFAREGDVSLVSTGDPERDVFHQYAHRFRVFVPAAWVRTAQDEALLRRALDAEKPAQAEAELCLIESHVCVGIQSTVGLDTIIGTPAPFHLVCTPADPADAAPTDPRARSANRQPRLGFDTVLNGHPAGRDRALTPGLPL